MTKLLLLPLLLLTLSPIAQATPDKADVLCLELEFVLEEFVNSGSGTLTQADVERITGKCYAAQAAESSAP